MIEGFVREALESGQAWIVARFWSIFGGVLAPFMDPLYHWYAYGALAFVAAFVIGWFFPFKWVRAGLGFALLLVGAYIAGGRQMHNDMKELQRQKRGRK